MGNLKRFPTPEPPEDPSPFGPAAAGHAIREKLTSCIAFRCTEDQKAWVKRHARELGLDEKDGESILMRSIVDRARSEQAQTRKHCLQAAAHELHQEVEIALSDGRVDTSERVRITRPLASIMAWLWPRRICS